MGLIIGILGGGVLSWIITHYYYKVSAKKTKKQNEDLQKNYQKKLKK